MEKKRIEYLDAIKGFAIILMVIGHVIAWNYTDYTKVCIYDPNQFINVKMGGVIWQLIYSFHMPLFFMVSGFLSYKIYSWESSISFLKKKITRLLIPWICTFGIIYFVRGSMGYWFLLCLFQISVLGLLIIKFMDVINKKNYIIIDIIIICLFYFLFKGINVQDWNLHGVSLGRFFGAFMPFFIGVLLRKYSKLFSLVVENSWFYTFGFIAFIFIFISRYFLDYGIIVQIIYRYSPNILHILGSLLAFHIFAMGGFKRFNQLLIYLGQKTLPIYVLHIMFVLQIHSVGDYILSQNAVTSIVLQICYAIVITTISIILSLLLYKILSMSPLLRKVLFGE